MFASCLLATVVSACGASPEQGAERLDQEPDVGSVSLAIMIVPPAVQCVQVRVHAAPGGVPGGMPLNTQNFTTSAGAAWSATVGLGAFSEGMVQIGASTFNVACSALSGATASFVADPVLTEITPGVRAALTLNFRQNFAVSAVGNFAPSVADVVVGNYSTGLLLADGSVRMLGNIATPSSLTGAVELGVGVNHACVRRTDATVWCWGSNSSGQLGNGTFTSSLTTPVQVSGLTGVTVLAVGGSVSCASTNSDTFCWGFNANGALGDGTTTNRNVPTVLPTVGPSARIAPNYSHTCAIRAADGQARCWGANSSGALGDGTTTSSLVPVAVIGLNAAVSIAVGASHSCATDADNKIYCWGRNFEGALGLGDTTSRSAVTRITSLGTTVVDVTATTGSTCALTTDGRVLCWGSGTYGALGDGSGINQTAPVEILQDAVQMSGGRQSFACALHEDNRVSCWGENNHGQLGDGTRVTRFVPVTAAL